MTFQLHAQAIMNEAKNTAARAKRQPDWVASKSLIYERFKWELSEARTATRGDVREFAKYLKELWRIFE